MTSSIVDDYLEVVDAVHEDIEEIETDVFARRAPSPIEREQVQSFDELLSSILQADLARLSVSENEDTRRISAWVAIVAVPTMIAGIYGMNFTHVSELHQVWGYPAVLSGMALICAVLYRGFKRNGWL